ncbi:MAG: cytochrome c nitrite reductase small subunit [Calditrichia bacterium]
MISLLRKLIPPAEWQRPVILLSGIITGLAFFIAWIANVGSYLTDDPRACVNCHVMTPQYITWSHSSHKDVTTCNDCHVPQDNVFKTYLFKAKDGLYHASIYTLRAEPQAIVMHEAGRTAVQNNCIRCHGDQVTDARTASQVEGHAASRLERTCWDCHRETPHGRVRSLASVGFYAEPLPIKEQQKHIVPDWLDAAVIHSNTTKRRSK